jgi:hypothetical protein
VAAVLAVATVLAGPLVGAAPARATVRAATEAASPLRVSITTLAPATIPRRGRVTLTGVVTNRSQQTWTDLRAYLFTSPTPIRTRSALAEAAASEADSPVGERLTGASLYDGIGDLAPGGTARYRLSVRRADLGITGEPGVYWVGVHVLGAENGARDVVADGRARTFMPLLRAPAAAGRGGSTRLALVVPVKEPVRRGGAARLLDVPSWQRTLAPDGRLDRLLKLSRRARQPITWVVDPAVLDAVQSIARGNPPLETGPTAGGGPTPTAGPRTIADPDSRTRTAARRWLQSFRRQAPAHVVGTVPYGDLDVAAVLDSPLRALYAQATRTSATTMSSFGVRGSRAVVDPVSGYLPQRALDSVGGDTTVLLADTAVPGAKGPVTRLGGPAPVVLTDTRAGSGGPAPNSQYAALEFRQRLLGDAALHAMSSRRDEPLVVSTPAHWNPGDAWSRARFFEGLDQPWLQLVDLPTVTAGAPSDGQAAGGATSRTPVYPDAERAAELPLANLRATDSLRRTGGVLARLLSSNDSVNQVLTRVALLGSSVVGRADPTRALLATESTTGYVRSQMARVHIEGPPFVMLSGQSGPAQVTVVNDLDDTVTVGLETSTPGSDLHISRVDPVRLGPGRRTTVQLQVRSDDIGVYAVTVRLTDSTGRRLGSASRFNIRTSHVSTVIWVVIAIGGALLFLAIAVRLYRRIRRRKATHGPRLAQDQVHRT